LGQFAESRRACQVSIGRGRFILDSNAQAAYSQGSMARANLKPGFVLAARVFVR
jgi:hypothetical protein